MKTAIHSYNEKYEVVVFDSFTERSLYFSTKWLGEERALALALELDEKLKDKKIETFEEASKIIDEYKYLRDHEYIDGGMGIVHDSASHKYIAVYQYFKSDYNFRISFSETLLGQQTALKVTKRFLKDISDTKNTLNKNNDDIDLIIEKYSLYKAKQQINREKWKRHKIIGKM